MVLLLCKWWVFFQLAGISAHPSGVAAPHSEPSLHSSGVAFLSVPAFHVPALALHCAAPVSHCSAPALHPSASALHPFYVSVTEIHHNAGEKSLEISVKIFTDDLENTLKKVYSRPADLVSPERHEAMDSLVGDYLRKHLLLKADGKPLTLKYLGFERESEAVWSYLEVTGVPAPPKRIDISNKLLYDHIDKQINMMHVTVGGTRRSGKVNYPDANWSAVF